MRVPRFFRTTAFKLLAAYTLVFTVFAGVLVLYLGHSTADFLSRQLSEQIDDEVQSLRAEHLSGGIRELVETVDRRSFRPGASLYLITDPTGRPRAGNIAAVPPGVLEDPGQFTIRYRRFDSGEGMDEHEALVRVFTLPGGFRAIVGRDVSEREEFRKIVRGALRLSVVVFVLLAILSGVLMGRRISRQLDSVSETSRQIMEGNLSGRIPLTGAGDEFDRLSESLNLMLDRIEQLMAGLKEVSDNIAHDLKTPLTRMRSRIEEALRGDPDLETARAVLTETLVECDDLIATFNALLSIARAEAGEGGGMVIFDAVELLRGVCDLYEPAAEERGAKFSVSAPEKLEMMGDRQLVAQAMTNLVDNALKYGIAEDAGDETLDHTVELSLTDHGEAAVFTVRDFGPGVPEEDLDRVLERFVRLEGSRTAPGSGLGLSLVNAVALRHQGTLVLENAEPGLRVHLTLPKRRRIKETEGEADPKK